MPKVHRLMDEAQKPLTRVFTAGVFFGNCCIIRLEKQLSDKENNVATFEIIKESDAPPPPKLMSASAKASLEIINALKPGHVAKITVPEGQSLRGIKSGISRVAKNNDKKVLTWDSDGLVYVKLV